MAAVYSGKQTRLRENVEKASSENERDSCAESSADPARPGEALRAESSAAGQAVRAGAPAPEAQEHAEVAASASASVPAIRIKEEPFEEGEYVTVHVDDVDEEGWEEQSGRGADFGRDE
ncbi:zinc finger protein 91-like, partial [Clarias magur]